MKGVPTATLWILGTILLVGTVAPGVSGALFFSPFFLFVIGVDGRIEFTWAADVPSEQPEWMGIREAVDAAKVDV